MQDAPARENKKFVPHMTVSEALSLHPDAGLVFASYRLSGCPGCSISELETLEQVCLGYGIPLDQFLDSLNNLLED